MAINLNDLARIDAVNKLAAKVSTRLNTLDGITFKAVTLVDNTINFFTSTDTTKTAAYTINIPAEQFLDQASTSFVPNFMFSGLAYAGATNPNLDGKPVLVLGVKTKSNDGKTENMSYSFIDVSHLVDTYTASDTSVTVSNYKIKANISPDAGNTLKLKSNGLYADGVTDTATTTTAGLMSAADKVNLSGKLDSDATAVAATNDSAGNVISDTYATKTELNSKIDSDTAANTYATKAEVSETYVSKADFDRKINAVRYGYRIDKNESDPDLRVEYIYDAAGMNPAHMVFDTDTTAGTDSDSSYFDYGSWESVWFVRDNKPCMLKSDGTVDYYLDPDDYSKKANGETDTDIANSAYDGNAMAQIPLCWVYRYEDDHYLYEIVSNVQWDENYKAYAHTRADGSIADYFFEGMFQATGNASKLRSLSGISAITAALNMAQHVAAATANGSGWYIGSWSRRELIRTLLVLISKSTDTQKAFGMGLCNYNAGINALTGTLNDKGQFFGYSSTTKQVKVFHIEDFWGHKQQRIAGCIRNGAGIYVKMTPEGSGYQIYGTTGYTYAGTVPNSKIANAYISKMHCTQYGMIPHEFSGSSSTYFCDYYWSDPGGPFPLYAGGSYWMSSTHCGAFAFDVHYSWNWNVTEYNGCRLSFA